MPQSEFAKSNRLPSLDGLRAISIALVILGHLGGTRGYGNLLRLGIGDYAHLGVTVFFVISGYLITRLMLSEHARSGQVSLKLFYARRALRLFPAAYAYIACVGLLWATGVVHLQPADIWHSVTYTMDFSAGRSWLVGHLWSLSVEEQFYLIWPCSFVLFGTRRAGWIAAGVLLLGPAARACDWIFLSHTTYFHLQMFPMVADSLAVGCLLAKADGWLEEKSWYLRIFQPAYSLALAALVLLTNHFTRYSVVVSIFGPSFMNVGLAVLIHRSVYCSRDWVGRFLNWEGVPAVVES